MPTGDTTIKKMHLVTYPMAQVPRVVWKKSPAPAPLGAADIKNA